MLNNEIVNIVGQLENKIMEAPYNVKFDQLDVMLSEIDLSGQKPAQVALVLAGAVLVQPDNTEPILSLSKLNVNKIVIDPKQKRAALGVVKLDQFKASILRETDGQLNLTRHFTPLPDEQASTLKRREAVAEASKPWKAKIYVGENNNGQLCTEGFLEWKYAIPFNPDLVDKEGEDE